MCLSPQSIENPNYGKKGKFYQFKDTVSRRINVPCGHCAECVAYRQLQVVQRVQMEQLANHLFFCTLTYNNSCLPRVCTSTGYEIRFADVSDVQDMFKRLRKRNAFGRPFRYFGVSELGCRKGRPHFHILFMLPKHEGDTFADCLAFENRLFTEVFSDWKSNKTDKFITFRGKVVRDWRHPLWVPNCTYVRKFVNGKLRTNYDLHYVNPVLSSGGVADVGFYVTKYMMKPSDRAVRLQQALHMNLPSDEYEHIWSLVRPRHFESEAFGLGCSDYDVDFYPNGIDFNKKRIYRPHPAVLAHLRKGIEGSKLMPGEPIPSIHSPDDGKFVPLAKYYKGRPEVFTMMDFLDFFYASKKVGADNVIYHEPDHPSQVDIRIDDYRRNLLNVSFQQTAYELDDLFDTDTDDFIEIPDIPDDQRETRLAFLEACEQVRVYGGYSPSPCPPASAGNE